MKIETFVKKASGKIDAAAFLREHRDYLCNFRSVLPVLALLEKKEIFPTPALEQICQLLMTETDPEKKQTEQVNPDTGEVIPPSIRAPRQVKEKSTAKMYQLFLFAKDERGGKSYAQTFEASDYGEAMRISNRRLFQNESSIYMDVVGMGVTTRIYRDDAVREILRNGPGGKMTTRRVGKTTGSLGWKPTAKNFVAKFSRG